LDLYNSLTDRIEDFVPEDERVSIYVCGITPYDTTHIGHAFTYTNTDVLIRYLKLNRLKVDYVQNVTDIDDDILRKARESGEDWRELGNRWTRHYIEDMQNLNVLPPNHYPRATEVISEIIQLIQQLLEEGVAYESGGSVYYSVDSFPKFGWLSKIKRDKMLPIANERGNHPNDPYKKDPLDFVLWQAQAAGEPAWDSPWGQGRPGWHIECSTMSTRYLGPTIDIHGGGADLTFPHHECEIAQIEPVTGQIPFVRFWMHSAMVSYKGEKMSKSLGNLIMVRDLLGDYSADDLRYYLASHHYRKPWSYDEKDLKEAAQTVAEIGAALKVPSGVEIALSPEPFWNAFVSAMDDDLNTPRAVSILHELAKEIKEASLARRQVLEAQDALRALASVIGMRLDQPQPDSDVIEGWDEHMQKFM